MFDSIRNHKKYLMGFLLILIIPSFVLFGIQGFTDGNQSGETVATVDGQDISKAEWDQAHKVEAQRLRESMPNIDAKLLDSDGARYASLERLVRDRVLAVAAQKDHLFTSDQRLARALQEDPSIAALRKPDGSLDVEGYRQLVARQGLTPEGFEARVRSDLSVRQVTGGVQSSGFAPPALAQVSLNAFFERREVRVLPLAASDHAAKVVPTDAEIEQFYKDNQALFQAPELIDVEYLVLDAAGLAQSVTLNEDALRAYYKENMALLSGDEERRASHILLNAPKSAPAAEREKIRAKAQALLEQLRKAPETFAAVAKAESQDPGSANKGGDLEFFGRGAMVKPFEDVVFAMAKGAISDVVETDFGFHIIQLTDIKAPKQRSFEEMRPQIEADLKKQQGQKLFAENADNFGNLVYEQADSLKPAADSLKLELRTAKGLTREPVQGSGVLANERLLAALFAPESVQNKRNTEAIETASGQLTAARVVQHTPARTLPLAEVRDSVRARLVAQRAAQLAKEEGVKKLAALRAGSDATALPASVVVSRDNPQGLAAPVLKAALSADAKQLPAWAGVDLGQQGYAIVKVEKLLPRAAPAAQNQEVQQYAQWWTAAETLAHYELLKERFKVKILVPEPAL
ncbi:SurA N-terminal domain-containing protein [Hydrogenophaga sp. SL48]|uniref:SurA N-terminal domain-containing protein n=1 Tax=Hydrogenophaga sp. SL48 TaxID=2806347 RepID=UPI001F1ABFB8|nr:SurA N-terminal domain-containing protein [Hydrogenophaga sp. SL48]UJW83159.1 SurA N-terminal domain-containing protein [Hydrogenophaga sp. SL48]